MLAGPEDPNTVSGHGWRLGLLSETQAGNETLLQKEIPAGILNSISKTLHTPRNLPMAPEDPFTASPRELLLKAFSETRHDINNVLAVLIAMAELSKSNPQNADRLVSAMLERGPVILQKLNDFQRSIETLADKRDPR